MKRIRPVASYNSEYPREPARSVDRRSFLKTMTVGAAAAGSMALLGSELSSRTLGGPAVSRYFASISFPRPYKYAGCKRVIHSLSVRTWDHQLSSFLNKKKEQAGILKVVYGVLAKHRCVDLTDASRRSRLQHKLAKAMVTQYTRRTKRKTTIPIVWIILRTPPKSCGSPVGPTLQDTPH